MPIMTDQAFNKKIMITCTGFSLCKSKLAAVLTGAFGIIHTEELVLSNIIHLSLFQLKYIVILFVIKIVWQITFKNEKHSSEKGTSIFKELF